MDWKPVNRETFQTILDEEIAGLSTEAAAIFASHAVPIFEQPGLRAPEYSTERMFVVARFGDRVLFYDDVEDEFGVEVPDSDGVLREWGTYGPLIATVLAAAREAE